MPPALPFGALLTRSRALAITAQRAALPNAPRRPTHRAAAMRRAAQRAASGFCFGGVRGGRSRGTQEMQPVSVLGQCRPRNNVYSEVMTMPTLETCLLCCTAADDGSNATARTINSVCKQNKLFVTTARRVQRGERQGAQGASRAGGEHSKSTNHTYNNQNK